MQKPSATWRDTTLPVLIGLAVFCSINALWNSPRYDLHKRIDHVWAAYLVGGSGVSLLLLWNAMRRGVMVAGDLGLAASAWSPPRRLLGLGLILMMGVGGYSSLPAPEGITEEPPAAAAPRTTVDRIQGVTDARRPKPTWGDFCAWFVHLLSASLAEMLVFCCLTFCFLEKWFRTLGWGKFLSWLAAATFASVAFGLYHYTHEPQWYKYVYVPLMPIMMINLVYFGLSRNFYLTFLLHNAFAPVGFTQEQYYASYPPPELLNPLTYLRPEQLWPVLISFFIPLLGLHYLESQGKNSAQSAATT